jgi:iron complex transport system permease protein
MSRFSLARLVRVNAVLLVLLGATLTAAVLLGTQTLQLGRVLQPASVDNPHPLLLALRLPRVLEGALVGAALATVGVAFQALLRNPLADPYVLGVSGGAAVGATLVIVAGQALGLWTGLTVASAGKLGLYLRQLFGFAGAAGATLLIYALARVRGQTSVYSMILAGVVFNATSAAMILFAEYLVAPDKAQEILLFITGHLAAEPWPVVVTLAVGVVVGVGLLFADSGRLNLLALGDEGAAQLGVDVRALRRRIFLVSSLLVGMVVSVAGLIGFVGMIIPHALRLLLGPDHRLLVPASALAGAIFLVASDTAARMLFPVLSTEPPVGVITALVGGPTFLWLMHRHQTRE